MGKIIRNGIPYSGSSNSARSINYDNTNSGLEATTAQAAVDELNKKIADIDVSGASNIVYLTKADYDALPESKLTDGIEYRITDANTDSTKARNIAYDNATSGLKATSVQDAIDKLASNNDISKTIYSTDEVKTNDIWIDGKPIYRKTVVANVTTSNTNFNIPHGIDNIGDLKSVDYSHSFLLRSNDAYGYHVPLPQIVTNASEIGGYQACITFINETNIIVQSGSQQLGNWTITILYTKTTD